MSNTNKVVSDDGAGAEIPSESFCDPRISGVFVATWGKS